MRHSALLMLSTAIGLVWLAQPAAAQTVSGAKLGSPTGDPVADAAGSGKLTEVVVTARRRDESLQITPVAVTAFTAADLKARGDLNIEDVAASTPNLSISPSTGTQDSARIELRGQVQNDSLITLDPSVGVYVDDVYLARAYSVLNDLLDVSQVEVLKGPQGTLYGRNTTGGAIKITTAPPSLSGPIKGFATVGAGNYGEANGSGAVSVPIIPDVLAVRYAFGYVGNSGYTNSYLVNQPSTTPIKDIHTDNLNNFSQRLSLLYSPTNKLSFEVVGSTFRSDTNGALAVNVGGDIENLTAPPPNFAFGFSNSPERKSSFYSALTPFAPFSHTRNESLIINSRYQITPDLWTKVILGYVDDRNDSETNAAGVSSQSVALVEFAPNLIQHQDQASGELQLGGTALSQRLNFVTGIYYFNEMGSELSPANTFVFGSPFGVAFQGYAQNRSESGYGNLTYKWTDRLSTSVGLRYTEDTKGLHGFNRNNQDICVYPAGPGIVTSTVPGGPCDLDRTDNFNYTTWEVEGDYKLTDSIFAYAKIGNGYRSGGEQLRAVNAASAVPYTPEEVVNYEGGLKTEFFDHRTRFNLAYFHSDYTNIQESQVDSPPAFPTTTTQVVNIGNATVDGVEVEGLARVTPALTVSGSAGYTDFQFASPLYQQVYTPKWKFAVSAVYKQPTPVGLLTGRIDYNYSDTIFVDFLKAGAPSQLPSYNVLNARLTLSLPGNVDLSAYGKNLTQDEYYTQAVQSANVLGATVGAPRTYGVEATYRF